MNCCDALMEMVMSKQDSDHENNNKFETDDETVEFDKLCDVNLESIKENELEKVQDKGYAWVICAAAFVCFVIIDGMLFSFGVLYIDLLEYFQESKSLTAWVGSTLMGTHLLVGPVTSLLVQRFGCRRVVCSGSLIAFIGFLCSAFVPNIPCLIFLYGVVGGIGCSMIYIPCLALLGFYFNKRRGLANGIANSGAGVGTFLYAPLTRFISDQYTWKGAMLILSAISLNMFVCGLCFRPIKQILYAHYKSKKLSKETEDESNVDTNSIVDPTVQTLTYRRHSFKHIIKQPLHLTLQDPDITKSLQDFHRIKEDQHLYNSLKMLSNSRNLSQKSFNNIYKPEVKKVKPFCSGSHMDIASDLIIKSRSHSVFANENIQTAEDIVKINWSIFKNPIFILIICMSVLWTTHATVLNFLPDLCMQIGIQKRYAGFLLSIIGGSNIIGRVLAGYFVDKSCCNALILNAGALMLGSLMCFCITVTNNYFLLAAESCIFGLCMATWTSLRPIILVDLLGLKNFTTTLGFLTPFQGLSFLIAGPVAGCIFDITNSYKLTYIVAGVAFFLSCILSFIIYKLSKIQAEKNLKKIQEFFSDSEKVFAKGDFIAQNTINS